MTASPFTIADWAQGRSPRIPDDLITKADEEFKTAPAGEPLGGIPPKVVITGKPGAGHLQLRGL